MAPDKKEATIERARKLTDSGQYAEAIEAWRQLLDDSPNDANVYNTIGDLASKSNANADRKSTRLNSSHSRASRMPSSA